VFKVSMKKVKKQTVTVRHSQEPIDAINPATGGGHLTDEDM
jgi:hypothetical protein